MLILMLKMNNLILNNRICKKGTILLALLFCCAGMFAQEVSVTARLDSTRIIIGDHLKMHLSVTAPSQKTITVQPSERWQLANC